jgi:anti-sigma B factor antagonist
MSRNTHRAVVRRESAHQHFSVLQIHERDDLEKIHPIGEIDLYTAPMLRDAIADTERRQVPNVLVDMSDVPFLALVGVQVLREANDRSTDDHRRLALVAPTHPVRRVLTLTEVTDELEIYVTLPNAMSALTRV